MRAVTYQGPDEVTVDDVKDAELPDSLGAVVQVTAAGICGSDVHVFRGRGFSDDVGYALGHEAVGVVVEVGVGVRRFAAGDRVLVSASVGCAFCAACATGHVTACAHRREAWKHYCYGLSHGLPGSQAEFVAVPHADVNLYTAPAEVSDDAAIVLTDNAPTAWYAARRASVGPGDTVVVIGGGPVGQMAVQAAFLQGAARVLIVEPLEQRHAAAVALGAEAVDAADPKSHIRDLTSGEGADAVIEAVGHDETIALAISAARHAGRVCVVGVSHNDAFPFRMQAVQTKELQFSAGLCSVQRELPTLLALTAAHRLAPAAVVSHHLPLADAAAGYALLADRVEGVGKIVLLTNGVAA
ncbi:alcohol dehydrogenase [Mycolicibacterium sp. P9-64]|uniref:zinc-binding dehydrogenase n=1 Tax=Mycolicibacterium sp. P9-64 TaxID=2024612 RepID=UPI0011EC7C61|nr:alcohol dehydrogenase catalytic domain-containing protein [Mycolicibacterium sp. P9-64]KAA0085584.1 alcohol dehydrogenase [Mycolicibacterium sp. P9-64]